MNDTSEPIVDGLTSIERERVLSQPGSISPKAYGDWQNKYRQRTQPGMRTPIGDRFELPPPISSPQVSGNPADRRQSEVVDLSTTAVKFDRGKDCWHLLPTLPLREVIRLLMYGAEKYAAHNWRHGFDYSRCYDSLMRHLQMWWLDGEDYDIGTDEEPGSKCHHLAAVAFYALILMEFHFTGTGRDDRRAHTSAAMFQPGVNPDARKIE